MLSTKDFLDRGWYEIESWKHWRHWGKLGFRMHVGHRYELTDLGFHKYSLIKYIHHDNRGWEQVGVARPFILRTIKELEDLMREYDMPVNNLKKTPDHYLSDAVFNARGWQQKRQPFLTNLMGGRVFTLTVRHDHHWELMVSAEGRITLREIKTNSLGTEVSMEVQEFPPLKTEQQLDTILSLYNIPNHVLTAANTAGEEIPHSDPTIVRHYSEKSLEWGPADKHDRATSDTESQKANDIDKNKGWGSSPEVRDGREISSHSASKKPLRSCLPTIIVWSSGNYTLVPEKHVERIDSLIQAQGNDKVFAIIPITQSVIDALWPPRKHQAQKEEQK